MNIITRENSSEKEISKFILSLDEVPFFQFPEFLRVLDNTIGYEGHWIGLENEGELVGCTSYYDIIDKAMAGTIKARRRIVSGGPVIKKEGGKKDTGKIDLLLDAIIISGKKPLFIEIRNQFDTSSYSKMFETKGLEYADNLNFLIDLTKSEEELMSNMTSSGRRMVKKSLKEGLNSSIAKNISDIDRFYEILSKTYMEKKIPLADISLFQSCFEILGDAKCRFILARDSSDKIVAGRMEMITSDIIYDWYACAEKESLSRRPNELLVWTALKEGMNLNIPTFDFGGAGRPNEEYGVREFKQKFGGRKVNFGRYTLVTKKISTALAKKGMNLAMKFKKR